MGLQVSQLNGYCNLTQRVRHNIEYGRAGGQSLQLDAFLPEGVGPFPVAIIVHGGGWVAGDRKSNVEPLFQPLVDGGFVCFSISYRLAKDLSVLGAAVEDVEQAIRYVQAHCAEFSGNRDRIALVGESAGGQLAAMAALGKGGSAIKAVLSLYAPTDLIQLARDSKVIPEPFRQAVQGAPWAGVVLARLRQLSPINHVRSGMPPFLLIHGTADPLVPFEQSRSMCRAIRNAGGVCDLLAVKGGGHGMRGWESAGLTSYKRLMIEWLQKRL
jgi:acetyl esterase